MELGEVPIISNKIIDKINIIGQKTDAQTLFKVDSITIHNNTFNIDNFQMLITTDRQVRGILEIKFHFQHLDKLINKHTQIAVYNNQYQQVVICQNPTVRYDQPITQSTHLVC